MINVVEKGKNGEREIYHILNGIVMTAMREMGFPEEQVLRAANTVQRNQNQTAVGGADLVNTFGLAIEVKRQEQLSINTWWAQVTAAATRNKDKPVLLFRQNHKSWRVVMLGGTQLPDGVWLTPIRVEIDWAMFLIFFKEHVKRTISREGTVRI